MLVPVIVGSDKKMASKQTGHVEFYPLYASVGNLHGVARRAHGGGVVLIAFLAIPETEKKHENTDEFRNFRRKIFHQSLAHILKTLRPGMLSPIVVRCADEHFRRAIFALSNYIADYPEQSLVTATLQYWCPICTAPATNLDIGPEGRVFRSRSHTCDVRARFDAATAWAKYGINLNIVPFTECFPRADIYSMISPDILHQLVKGCFKDHLVTWIEKYIFTAHGKVRAKAIWSDIDRRIAISPSQPGLRRFPEGRHFKQWTGDDSKALMKVILPALVGYIPDQMIKAMSTFLDFCYLVRRPRFDLNVLDEIDEVVKHYHVHREIFRETGLLPRGFNIPKQHAMSHYRYSIQEFGAPNGLCTSITESKHIESVNDTYSRTNKFNALEQMLIIAQRMGKLAAARADFERRGMLESESSAPLVRSDSAGDPSTSASAGANAGDLINASESSLTDSDRRVDDGDLGDADDLVLPVTASNLSHSSRGISNDGVEGAVEAGHRLPSDIALAKTPAYGYPMQLHELGRYIRVPTLPALVYRFLREQIYPNISSYGARVWQRQIDENEIDIGRISVFHSASATYTYPGDPSGSGGMQSEQIRANPSWRGHKRYDCVLVNTDPSQPGMHGMHVARVHAFFSFNYLDVYYPCALVRWFILSQDTPDECTGMWIVEPEYNQDRSPSMSVIHADSIHRSAHLLPVFGRHTVPDEHHFSSTLSVYSAFYLNKYADHHSHELLYEPLLKGDDGLDLEVESG